jgi:hypothetical protein
MAYNLRALAVWAIEYWHYHGGSLAYGWFCSTQTPAKDSRSTDLKHLPLLYGNARLPTISLTLALPDGRAVDLGQAPVTDQQGVAGLTGRVNQHYGRLFGAVFIGGALRGGMQALQSSIAQASGVGQVAAGIGSLGNQAVTQRAGRAFDTRPTIEVDAEQLCNVLLTKPMYLPAL